jgi:hypothetical protein
MPLTVPNAPQPRSGYGAFDSSQEFDRVERSVTQVRQWFGADIAKRKSADLIEHRLAR